MSTASLAYLITFRCYATWLPGDERGYVDRESNFYGTPYKRPSSDLSNQMNQFCRYPPFTLNEKLRQIVLSSLVETSQTLQWELHAAHVRTNHIHLIVSAPIPPEKVLSSLKRYCTRALNMTEQKGQSRWSRHGSTRYLWCDRDIYFALHYVVHQQGEKMALYVSPALQEYLTE